MHEKLFPVTDTQPVEYMHRLLNRLRNREQRHQVTLGSPPFERDELNRITAVRLRFTPRTIQ